MSAPRRLIVPRDCSGELYAAADFVTMGHPWRSNTNSQWGVFVEREFVLARDSSGLLVLRMCKAAFM